MDILKWLWKLVDTHDEAYAMSIMVTSIVYSVLLTLEIFYNKTERRKDLYHPSIILGGMLFMWVYYYYLFTRDINRSTNMSSGMIAGVSFLAVAVAVLLYYIEIDIKITDIIYVIIYICLFVGAGTMLFYIAPVKDSFTINLSGSKNPVNRIRNIYRIGSYVPDIIADHFQSIQEFITISIAFILLMIGIIWIGIAETKEDNEKEEGRSIGQKLSSAGAFLIMTMSWFYFFCLQKINNGTNALTFICLIVNIVSFGYLYHASNVEEAFYQDEYAASMALSILSLLSIFIIRYVLNNRLLVNV